MHSGRVWDDSPWPVAGSLHPAWLYLPVSHPLGPRGSLGQPSRGQGTWQEALPKMFCEPGSQKASSTFLGSDSCHLAHSDSDGAAAQVGDRAPSEQDPAPRQAPRPLRVPGGGRLVIGRHAGATPGLPQGTDADRQDPGPHGQRALGVHRAQEEVGVPGQSQAGVPGRASWTLLSGLGQGGLAIFKGKVSENGSKRFMNRKAVQTAGGFDPA